MSALIRGNWPASRVLFTMPYAGAQQRTQASVNADTVNARHWIKADGVTDDWANLQAIINDGVPCIDLPVLANVRMTKGLTINQSYQTIRGNWCTLLLDDAAGTASHITLGNGTTRINANVLQDMTFTRAQVATAGAAVTGSMLGVLTLRNLRVYGNSQIWRGFDLEEVIMATIRENYVQNTVEKGMYIAGNALGSGEDEDMTILLNRFDTCGDVGLSGWNFVEGLYLRQNIFYNCKGFAVTLNAAAAADARGSFKLQHNDFDTCAGGVYADYVSNMNIDANWFSNNSGVNLQVNQHVTGAVVNSNQLYGSASYVSMQLAGTDTVVCGNYMSGGNDLIHFKPTAESASVTGNVLKNSAGWGINNFEAPDAVIETANLFKNNASGDVSTGGTSMTTTGNAAL